MHRDPRWFPEPLRFWPERFEEGWENKIPKGAYLPFGAGPRYCIGQMFATLEMQIILSMVMQCYHLELVANQEVVPLPLVVQRPRDGVRMIAQERQPLPTPALT